MKNFARIYVLFNFIRIHTSFLNLYEKLWQKKLPLDRAIDRSNHIDFYNAKFLLLTAKFHILLVLNVWIFLKRFWFHDLKILRPESQNLEIQI